MFKGSNPAVTGISRKQKKCLVCWPLVVAQFVEQISHNPKLQGSILAYTGIQITQQRSGAVVVQLGKQATHPQRFKGPNSAFPGIWRKWQKMREKSFMVEGFNGKKLNRKLYQ